MTQTAPQPPTVLATRGLGKRFGGISATCDVTLELKKGARHALIGPNGAGKTTLINLLTGGLAPSEGTIVLDGQDITRLAPHQRVPPGLGRGRWGWRGGRSRGGRRTSACAAAWCAPSRSTSCSTASRRRKPWRSPSRSSRDWAANGGGLWARAAR